MGYLLKKVSGIEWNLSGPKERHICHRQETRKERIDHSSPLGSMMQPRVQMLKMQLRDLVFVLLESDLCSYGLIIP